MKKIPFPAGAIMAGAALAHLSVSDAPSTRTTVVSITVPSATSHDNSEFVKQPLHADENGCEQNVCIGDGQEWTKKQERQFLRLAEQEALGRLNSQASLELERLSTLRNTLKSPRSGEDVLRDFDHRKITRDLLTALSRYVAFHKTANRSES